MNKSPNISNQKSETNMDFGWIRIFVSDSVFFLESSGNCCLSSLESVWNITLQGIDSFQVQKNMAIWA